MSQVIDTAFLDRSLAALQVALELLGQTPTADIRYDVYRSACVKEFEICLEQSGKLLRRVLADYAVSPREVDALNFKDVFRYAAKHQLVDADACVRWFGYRDNRNNTAHDYGKGFAEATLVLLPQFMTDAHALSAMIRRRAGNAAT